MGLCVQNKLCQDEPRDYLGVRSFQNAFAGVAGNPGWIHLISPFLSEWRVYVDQTEMKKLIMKGKSFFLLELQRECAFCVSR